MRASAAVGTNRTERIVMAASSSSSSSSSWSVRRRPIHQGRSLVLGRRPTARFAVLRSKDSFPLEPLDEIKLWIDANLASKLGGGVKSVRGGAGGSGWAQTHVLELRGGGKLFAKIARGRGKDEMFRGELEGLNAMNGTNTVGVPRAFHCDDLYGGAGKGSWILMEYLDLSSRLDQAELGLRLGQMHLADPVPRPWGEADDDVEEEEGRNDSFGFYVDNTIGATPQPNGWTETWADFYREKRLLHQLELTGDSKLMKLGDKALDRLEDVFGPCEPIKPSILHGDLWSGNVAADAKGNPVIFDPASYYGHHEAEFGMSWCASFTENFWAAYHDVVPKESEGYEDRRQIYQLYHYLNHLNLFGGSYYYSCENILKRFN